MSSSKPKSILLFGDGSMSIHPALSQILRSRGLNSLVSKFADRVQKVLQEELARLPLQDREGIPNLSDLHNLAKEGISVQNNQIVAPALLILLQLSQFFVWYEARPEEPYPNSSNSIVIGLCLGELSAAAVSSARSLTELLPLAVESVRIAFRVGVSATTVRNELEQPSFPDISWAMVVAREAGLSNPETLERIHNDIGITGRKKSYISAFFRKSVTLQGPPSTLDKINSWFEENFKELPKAGRQRIPVFTPYHAPHLFSRETVEQVLAEPDSLSSVYHNRDLPESLPKLISPVTGSYYSDSSRRSLMESVIFDITAEPIYWDMVSEGCVSHVIASDHRNWIVRPFGPTGSAGALVSSLQKLAKAEVELDATFGSSDTRYPATATKEPIAIVGMAGRFPNSEDHNAFWRMLEEGVDCHKIIPNDRFDAQLYASKDSKARNSSMSPYGCFMDNPGMFDARFFNMSPKEALQTDPQQRLILTTANEALEMAGFVPNRTPSTQLERVGSFLGQTTHDYAETNAAQDINTYHVTGNVRAFGPGHINYHFKFGGPACNVDTACSSSSVALNLACNSIWARECDTAIAGGMLLMSSPDSFSALSRAHFLSETGSCKTFDDAADGYCRGETVASVVIKRLEDAKADNDNILAVIIGAATNYSAETVSITRPHAPTQEVLYKKILNDAGIRPFDVDYIEMHGTGTQHGDAAEMTSVSNVFAPATPRRPADRPLYLGAVKANVGHGESASGVTSLIKTLLVLRNEKLPPHVGIKSGRMNHTFPDLEQRNIKIPLEGAAFPWKQGRKRRALINNFSAAGGNTVLLLEEPPKKNKPKNVDSRPEHVVNVTAKTAKSIKNNIQNLVQYLDSHGDASLSSISYTTTARKVQYPLRISVVAATIAQLKERLISALEKSVLEKSVFEPQIKLSNLVMTFTGQGSLYLPLAEQLFTSSTLFRSDLVRFDQIAQDYGFLTFLPAVDGSVTDPDSLTPTQSQLALTAVQMALYRLWSSWGVRPDAVLGHSLGEYAALYASGVLSANDTLYLVGYRANLLEKNCTSKTHSMLAMHATIATLRTSLGKLFEELELACLNGPEDVVLSGPVNVVQDACKVLKADRLQCTILNVPFAFHSSQVDPILPALRDAAEAIKFMKPRIPIISPLLGTVVREAGIINPSYLQKHARESVNFYGAVVRAQEEKLVSAGTVWLELGPDPLCLGMIRATLGKEVRGLPTLRKAEKSWVTAARTISALHTLGLDIKWQEYHRNFESGQSLLELPTYAFDEKNYWIAYKGDWMYGKGKGVVASSSVGEPGGPATTTVQKMVSQELKGKKAVLVFETDLSDPHMHECVSGHRLNGLAVCPSGVYADMALTVADYIRKTYTVEVPSTGLEVMDMEIIQPVMVPIPRIETPQLLRIQAEADLNTGIIDMKFSALTGSKSTQTPNAQCQVAYGESQKWLDQWRRSSYLVQKRIKDLERGVQEGTTDKLFSSLAYKLFAGLVFYGPKYQSMQELLIDSEELEATALIKLYNGSDAGTFFSSPYWLDGLAQLSGFLMNGTGVVDPSKVAYVSHGWSTYQFAELLDATQLYRVHVKMQAIDASVVAGDISIFKGDKMVGLAREMKFQRLPRPVLDSMLTGKPPAGHDGRQSKKAPAAARNFSAAAPLPAPTSVRKQVPRVIAQENSSTRILEIVADEIGVPMTELAKSSTFAEFGVDSLLSLNILSTIREKLQLDLPSTVFQDCPTVGELLSFLGNSDSSNDDSDVPIPTPTHTPEPIGPIQGLDSDTRAIDAVNAIVADQIGISVEELLASNDLSEFGVDSLMSLSILAAIREQLGYEVPPNAIDGAFTMLALLTALNLKPTTVENQSSAEPDSKPKLASSPSLCMLLQGNPKTAKQTLFLFPDGSGSATSYSSLPTISPETCVLALNSPFLTSPTAYTCSLEEATAIMVASLRARQPHGPYMLGGWSAGGMYAYEAAKQLLADGEIVDKLILIDSPCRLVYGPMPLPVLDFVSTSGVVSGQGSTIAPKWLIDHFHGTIRAVAEYAPTGLSKEVIGEGRMPKTFLVWASKGLLQDLDEGKKKQLDVDLTDAMASWLFEEKIAPGPQGWDKLLWGEKLNSVVIEGNHFSMVHPPQCESLTNALSDALLGDGEGKRLNWRQV